MPLPSLRHVVLACVAGLLLLPAVASASDLPPGFTESVAFSVTAPTTLRLAPDGRVFVALKSGIIDVFDSIDDPTPTVYADLRTKVDDFCDRGLLGLALDPQFTAGDRTSTSLYTYNKDPNSAQFPRWNDDCPEPSRRRRRRLRRHRPALAGSAPTAPRRC